MTGPWKFSSSDKTSTHCVQRRAYTLISEICVDESGSVSVLFVTPRQQLWTHCFKDTWHSQRKVYPESSASRRLLSLAAIASCFCQLLPPANLTGHCRARLATQRPCKIRSIRGLQRCCWDTAVQGAQWSTVTPKQQILLAQRWKSCLSDCNIPNVFTQCYDYGPFIRHTELVERW